MITNNFAAIGRSDRSMNQRTSKTTRCVSLTEDNLAGESLKYSTKVSDSINYTVPLKSLVSKSIEALQLCIGAPRIASIIIVLSIAFPNS